MEDVEDRLEALKTDVWTKLPQLNLGELEQVCTALDLQIPASKLTLRLLNLFIG